jgi:hypothetical protein
MRVYGYHFLNPDCSPQDEVDMDVRIVKKPLHGKAEIAAVTLFATFNKDSNLFKCSGRKAPSLALKYKSADNFVGKDIVQLFVFQNGWAWEITVNINVR